MTECQSMVSSSTGWRWRRFAFSGVTPTTGLLHIDDTVRTLTSRLCHAFLTGDLEVEGKGTNKVIIPEERNLSLESPPTMFFKRYQSHADNTLLSSVTSGTVKEGEEPWGQEHLGKKLFEDFSRRTGNQFYTFGFKCIQLYLREGLVNGAMGSYEEKQLATSVASEPEVQEWIRNYVMERRVQLNHHINNGVADYALHLLFTNEVDPMVAKYWDKTRLLKNSV